MLQISTDVLNKNREANGCTKPKTFNVPPDPKFLLQMKSRRLERIEKKFKRMQNQKSLQESLIKSQNIYDSQRDLKKNSQTKINEIIQVSTIDRFYIFNMQRKGRCDKKI